jgi:hypothetical protein
MAGMADTSSPQPPVRWYHPTPGRLLVGLLALEGLLVLSEWLRLLPFNRHKGWTVLIAIACVGVFMVVMLGWWLAAIVFRVRFQFSLRSLFGLTLAVALPCSWLATEMKWARQQSKTVALLGKRAGILEYDYQLDESRHFIPHAEPPGPAPLRQWLGRDFFADMAFVCLASVEDADLERLGTLTQLRYLSFGGDDVTDAGLAHLSGMHRLEVLNLVGTQVTDVGLAHLTGLGQLQELVLVDAQITDAGLAHLTALGQLRELDLCSNQVSDEGVKRLQQALPNCRINY